MLLKHVMLCKVVLGPHQQAGGASAEIASKDKMKKVLIKCLAFRLQEESSVKKNNKRDLDVFWRMNYEGGQVGILSVSQ